LAQAGGHIGKKVSSGISHAQRGDYKAGFQDITEARRQARERKFI
jgi:hypothetical protein